MLRIPAVACYSTEVFILFYALLCLPRKTLAVGSFSNKFNFFCVLVYFTILLGIFALFGYCVCYCSALYQRLTC
jgi:hypothetical protein